MKRGTPTHFKMKRLAKALRVELPYAVGLMEMLWHFTGDQAPRGDIGRMEDYEIADGVCWKKDPGILVDSLIATGWLDKSETHRLIVHDWDQHADNSVKKKLSRMGEDFLTEYRQSTDSVQTVSDQMEDIVSTRAGKARQGKAVVSFPEEKIPEEPSPLERKISEVAGRIHARHPPARRCSLAEVIQKLTVIAKKHPASQRIEILDEVDRSHEACCQSEQWQKQGGEFAKGLDNWLAPTKERWTAPPPILLGGAAEVPGHKNPGLLMD